MKTTIAALTAAMFLAACETPVATAPAPAEPERPMDEVPVQMTLANGDRHYSFKSGCVVVLEPQRAVVKSETRACELHHRDIALLYASGD
ncbi:hypothetical protein PARHAE_03932 [Paracoccus haematequi]|uniref:Uncharacterized protein n=1 Tax=Paracoccus haematequi TaxID=2491866 RepID=A0A3S4EUJ9_9RHOB|nr:hypothetical protein [Paracoccus haematequi]VDS10714.1 hypothetical protein PARHAE_03932 [Paracoccus haematequi]